MEISYFCEASPPWEDLKGFMEKSVLLLHRRIRNLPAPREPVKPIEKEATFDQCNGDSVLAICKFATAPQKCLVTRACGQSVTLLLV